MVLKKSLFNKPSWASKATPDTKEDAPIFTSNTYEGILKAQKEKEEQRAAREKAKEEERKHRGLSKSLSTYDEGEKSVKKRRISQKEDESEDGTVSLSSDADETLDEDDLLPKKRTLQKLRSRAGNTTRQSPREQSDSTYGGSPVTPKTRSKSGRQVKSASDVTDNSEIERQTSGNEDVQIISSTTKAGKPKPYKTRTPDRTYDSGSEEDEIIKELKRAARDEARRKRETSLAGPSPEKPNQTQLGSPLALKDLASEVVDITPTLGSPPSSTLVLDDPQVEILITTIIPNARSLLVSRKASQPLDHVRTYWCQHNNLDSSISQRVFFTWNGSRLYDTTTMRGILDHIKRKHGTKSDGSDLAEGKIEIEAVTQEIFDLRKRQKERAKEEAMRVLSPSSEYPDDLNTQIQDHQFNNAVDPSTAIPQQPQPVDKNASSIIIRLTTDPSLQLEPMDLRVHPNTTMARIARGYAKTKGLQGDVEAGRKELYLLFDGERMDTDDTVADVEWEDGDEVQVRIKDLPQ